jgi:hypothetical protein
LVKEGEIAGEVEGITVSDINESSVSLEVVSGKYKFELLH